MYIEALLVDKELADQVWEAWDTGEIDDQVAWLAWWLLTELRVRRIDMHHIQVLIQSIESGFTHVG